MFLGRAKPQSRKEEHKENLFCQKSIGHLRFIICDLLDRFAANWKVFALNATLESKLML
jgi:hypothetical protein